ncbi:Rv0361 family membrane protein [Tomitella biformata]|uniref:Rv0361 family membrane protein n=1 Tax=Tomitella biformata TaxID=630403 RepID=UPI0004B60454|nr:hypothetical protein [Tomitella biformata]
MNIRHRATAVGKTVAALAIIGAVAASCSSSSNDAAAASTTEESSASATADVPSSGAPASPEDQAEIVAITKTYVTGLNNGDAKMLEHAMCQATLAKYTDLSVNARPSATPQQVNTITDVTVAGDLGFGTVEYSLVNDPSASVSTVPLAYKNEGGWKVCDEP